MWRLIAELNPDLPCWVVTNGTLWNRRVTEALELVRFDIAVSLDGISPDTYESIRPGARLAAVLANIDRFRRYAARVGTSVTINHCLMPQNLHEFPQLLRWAEGLGLHVDVQVVRRPYRCSIAQLPIDELERGLARFEEADDDLSSSLAINLGTWRTELARLRSWVASGDAREVLGFPVVGAAGTDEAAVLAELVRRAGGAAIGLVVDLGRDERIVAARADGIGAELGPLEGRELVDLTGAVTERLGPMGDHAVEAGWPEGRYAVSTYGSTVVHSVVFPRRSPDGRATGATVAAAWAGA